jgi:hypothetical protein
VDQVINISVGEEHINIEMSANEHINVARGRDAAGGKKKPAGVFTVCRVIGGEQPEVDA